MQINSLDVTIKAVGKHIFIWHVIVFPVVIKHESRC